MTKPKLDYIFLFSVLALSAIGLIMVFSASPTMGIKLGDSFYYVKRHILYLLLGFAALYFGSRIDLKILRKSAVYILIISLALLFVVFVPGLGLKVKGAVRWIDLFIFSFQPSELVKFAVILFLAQALAKQKEKIKKFFSGLFPLLLLLLLVVMPLIKQPDLGTAVVISGAALILFSVAGAKILHLSAIGLAGVAAALGLSLTSPYRLRRLIAYINPWRDPLNVGFQIIQSFLAIGSGGIFGLGLGASRQKFFYLPQQFTDFIFAILCEELGFIGGVGVVLLFALFALRGLRIANQAEDLFKTLLAAGIVSWITLQTLINLLVVVGLLPTTGIPLPFISYGGTATIMNLFAVGILLNISVR